MSPGRAFVGTPAQIIDQMAPFVGLGVDYFMLGSEGFPNLTTLEMLKQEVLPMLNAHGYIPLAMAPAFVTYLD